MSKKLLQKTGITRPVDDLGRIVLPKELRTIMGIREGDRLEIMVTGEHIVLAKAVPCCVICGSTKNAMIEVDGTNVCRPCAVRLSERIVNKLPSDR